MEGVPLDVIRSWPEPNYVDPEYQGPQLHIVGALFLILSIIVVTLRIWVRVYIKKSAGWDDWIMVAATPFLICSTATVIFGTTVGWGRHIWDTRPEWNRLSLLTSWISQLLFVVIMLLVKLSILTSYLRFSATTPIWYAIWGMIVLIAMWGLAFVFVMFFTCRPLHAYWELMPIAGETCLDDGGRTLAFTISNLVTDVIVLVLPIPIFWRLSLPIRERVVIIAMMNAGLLACAASGVRIHYARLIYQETYDVTWYGYNIFLWILVEINLAVICASIPTLRPLAKKYFPRLGFKASSDQSLGPDDIQTPNLQCRVYIHENQYRRGSFESKEIPQADGSPQVSWLRL